MKKKKSDIEAFIALPDEEKERIFQELEAMTTEAMLARSRPLNARERRQWAAEGWQRRQDDFADCRIGFAQES
jgi:hypothetical protein